MQRPVSTSTPSFRLGDRAIEPGANRIDGQRLDSKAMEVLLCLAQAAPDLVLHARLLECVWPDVVVGDNVLHQAVAHLRKALGDDARSPRFIENIPRRGYRLLRKPERLTDDDSLDRTTGGNSADAGGTFRASIVVLPFENVSPEPDQKYFIDGLCEELINVLARNPELKVTSRTSAFHYRHRTTDLRSIARQLGVAHVLEGSVRKAGARIRISVRLIDARTEQHLWSETFDRKLGDVFALQDEIAGCIFEKLHVSLLRPVAAHRAADVEAYLRFVEARRELEHGDRNAIEKATRLLKEAVSIDPSCTCGWIELARVSVKSGNREAADLLTRQAADHNPTDPLINAWLGVSAIQRSLKECDLATGAAHLTRALIADPSNVNVLHSACVLLIRLGRISEAIRLCTWLLSRDPMCLVCRIHLGQSYLVAQRFADAERVFMAALTTAPDSLVNRVFLAFSQLLLGKTRVALSTLDDYAYPHLAFDYLRAWGLRDLGDCHVLPETLRRMETEWGSPAYYLLMEGYTILGDLDAAFEWLERSADLPSGDLLYPHLKHQLTPLHGDPRWTAALGRFRLLPDQLERVDFDLVLPGTDP